MARRRQAEEDDGLELFLSTSCDSFGGIVFIMLLICLLPTKKLDEMLHELNRSKAQLAKMQAEMADLESKGVRREDLERQFAKLEADQAQKEAKRLAELQAALKARQAELEKRTRERDELTKTVGAARSPDGEIRYTRRPYLHEVEKQSYALVLYQNHVYLPQNGRDYHFNEDDFKLIKHPNFLQFEPLPGKGLEVQKWLQSEEGLRAVTEALPRDKVLVNIMVYPDSIRFFDTVRSAFTAQGYDYNWTPLAGNESVNLATGGGSGSGPPKKNDAQ